MTSYNIGQVAAFSGLTVRTLHHYDEIGLLTPTTRRDNGYRVYDDHDLERLRQILVYRELGIPLADIAAMLDVGGEPADMLLEERHRVTKRISRLRTISDLIDDMIESQRSGTTMNPTDNLKVFGDFDPAAHEDEAKERWGDTDAYAQSAKRTSSYTPQDWQTIKEEAAAINEQFVSLMAEGIDPSDEMAARLVDAHRAHISKWYYDCSREIHAGLGQMYATDSRFAKNIDTAGEGLAEYLSAAIAARYNT
jgi:DNA-binding transcriptional MerR regulator